jgi:hypothetical protein
LGGFGGFGGLPGRDFFAGFGGFRRFFGLGGGFLAGGLLDASQG